MDFKETDTDFRMLCFVRRRFFTERTASSSPLAIIYEVIYAKLLTVM